MTISFYLIVPLCAIFHWLVYIKPATSPDNIIRAWILCYPLICLLTIGSFFHLISDLIAAEKAKLYEYETNKKPQRYVDNLLNLTTASQKGKEKNSNDQSLNCLERFWGLLSGGDPSRIHVEQENIIDTVSKEAAIYRINRSF